MKNMHRRIIDIINSIAGFCVGIVLGCILATAMLLYDKFVGNLIYLIWAVITVMAVIIIHKITKQIK